MIAIQPSSNASPLAEARATSPLDLVRTKLPLPKHHVVAAVGPGVLWTCRGGTRATDAAFRHGLESPKHLTYLAEDLGLIRYTGRNGGGQETWSREENPITHDDVATVLGEDVLNESGFRWLNRGSRPTATIPFGGTLPGRLAETDVVLVAMGLHPSQLAGTPLADQAEMMGHVSRVAALLIFASLHLYPQLGGPLRDMVHPSEVAAFGGHAYPPFDKIEAVRQAGLRGEAANIHDSVFSLGNAAVGLDRLLMGGRRFNVKGRQRDPSAALFDEGRPCVAATAGPHMSIVDACSTFLQTLYASYERLMAPQFSGLPRTKLALALASEAPFVVEGDCVRPIFESGAGVSLNGAVEQAIAKGWTAPLASGETHEQRWNVLPPREQRRILNAAVAPMTKWKDGTMLAEGAAAQALAPLDVILEEGLVPNAILAAVQIGGNESGGGDMSGLGWGPYNPLASALRFAKSHHGVVARLIRIHGTSTSVYNYVEPLVLSKMIKDLGWERMSVSGLMNYVGHLQGAAGGLNSVMAVRDLAAGSAVKLLDFREDEIDGRLRKRIEDVDKYLAFEGGMMERPEAIAVQNSGMGGPIGAAVWKQIPTDSLDAMGEELLRYEGVTTDDIARWKDKAAVKQSTAAQWDEDLRTGRKLAADVILELGFS